MGSTGRNMKSRSEGTRKKQASKLGMKRTHDEAFSGSSLFGVIEGT